MAENCISEQIDGKLNAQDVLSPWTIKNLGNDQKFLSMIIIIKKDLFTGLS